MGVAFHEDWHVALKKINKAHQQEPKEPLGLMTKERASLLKLVIGMAMGPCYEFNPRAKRNEATAAIEEDLDRLGIHLDQVTILKWLNTAAEQVLPADFDEK